MSQWSPAEIVDYCSRGWNTLTHIFDHWLIFSPNTNWRTLPAQFSNWAEDQLEDCTTTTTTSTVVFDTFRQSTHTQDMDTRRQSSAPLLLLLFHSLFDCRHNHQQRITPHWRCWRAQTGWAATTSKKLKNKKNKNKKDRQWQNRVTFTLVRLRLRRSTELLPLSAAASPVVSCAQLAQSPSLHCTLHTLHYLLWRLNPVGETRRQQQQKTERTADKSWLKFSSPSAPPRFLFHRPTDCLFHSPSTSCCCRCCLSVCFFLHLSLSSRLDWSTNFFSFSASLYSWSCWTKKFATSSSSSFSAAL